MKDVTNEMLFLIFSVGTVTTLIFIIAVAVFIYHTKQWIKEIEGHYGRPFHEATKKDTDAIHANKGFFAGLTESDVDSNFGTTDIDFNSDDVLFTSEPNLAEPLPCTNDNIRNPVGGSGDSNTSEYGCTTNPVRPCESHDNNDRTSDSRD